jgi:hypothetical protein
VIVRLNVITYVTGKNRTAAIRSQSRVFSIELLKPTCVIRLGLGIGLPENPKVEVGIAISHKFLGRDEPAIPEIIGRGP